MSRWLPVARPKWWTGGLILLAVVGGLSGWWAGDRGGAARWSAGATSPTGTEQAAPAVAAAADPGGPTPNAAGRQPAGSAAAVPPYVQPFARQPGATPQRRLSKPTAGVEIAEGADGCDHAYGDPTVCVPWQFPPGVTDKCGWLAAHGFKPLKITGGRDRHGLDRNGDGIACGAGD